METFNQFVGRVCNFRGSPLPIEEHQEWYRAEYNKELNRQGASQQVKTGKPFLPYPKPETYESKSYREYISTHPCWICGKGPTEAAHQTFGRAGTSTKAPDSQCLPECGDCHRVKKHQQGRSPQTIAAKEKVIEFILDYIEKEYRAIDSRMVVIDFLTNFMKEKKI